MKKYLCTVLVTFGFWPAVLFCQSAKTKSGTYLQQIKREINVLHNYPRALALTREAVKAYPRDVDFQYLLGKLYLLTRDTVKAERKLAEIIQKVPNYKEAYLSAAALQQAKGYKNKALELLNNGLTRFPGDYQLNRKKLDIFAMTHDYVNGDRQADLLLSRFPKDSNVLRAYVNYHNEAGNYYLKTGNQRAAEVQFSQAAAAAPGNSASTDGGLAAVMQQGNDENSLAYVNRLLMAGSGSYELWMKKLGLLQQMRRYPDAIETWQVMQKKFPGDGKLRQLGAELQLEAARYYKQMDPYYEYLKVLEQSPGNREALNNVIAMAISRNMNQEALEWLNKALKGSPNDKELLTKKLGLLERMGKTGPASAVAAQLLRLDPSSPARETYIDFELKRAGDFTAGAAYDSAASTYQGVLALEPAPAEKLQVLNYLVGLAVLQKNYPLALDRVDKAIEVFPTDVPLQIKKASILQQNEAYGAAAELYETLYRARPDNAVLRSGLTDSWLGMAKPMMEAMDYDNARAIYEKVIAIDPDNKLVLNYLINIELARGRLGSGHTADSAGANANLLALHWIDKALGYYPDDQTFLMKKSEALIQGRSFAEALALTDALHKRYPYNTVITGNYKEQLTLAAVQLRQAGDSTGALHAWQTLRQLNPKDSLALLAVMNAYQHQNNFEAVVSLADTALGFYPDNSAFLLKKAVALESMQSYDKAAVVAAALSKSAPGNAGYSDYAAYLRSKGFHHQIGFAFLSSHFDSAQTANVATLQYSYLTQKWTLTGKLNFAGRASGTGLQLDLESYINHSKSWYSYVNLAVAGKVVFPKWRAGYSIFHSFAKTWELELGGRILDLDSVKSVSAVGAVAHYFGDFWVNLKGYSSFLAGNQYTALSLTARQYLNNKTDFFYAILGYGNSPDDVSRIYDFNRNLKFTTYSIGAGYQKTFNYRNTISINGSWYNQKIGIDRYRNQYDIFLSFSRKF